jgi:hypothetical protein
MRYAKTALGQDVMKTRSIPLGPRRRTVLLLCDGQRDEREVLASTHGMGSGPGDLEELFKLGLIEPVAAPSAPAPEAADSPTQLAAVDLHIEPAPLDETMRFRLAYQEATQLTAGLGLRGFRLQLAVEQAMNLGALEAIASRLQEALVSAHGPQKGPVRMARFEELLRSR